MRKRNRKRWLKGKEHHLSSISKKLYKSKLLGCVHVYTSLPKPSMVRGGTGGNYQNPPVTPPYSC